MIHLKEVQLGMEMEGREIKLQIQEEVLLFKVKLEGIVKRVKLITEGIRLGL